MNKLTKDIRDVLKKHGADINSKYYCLSFDEDDYEYLRDIENNYNELKKEIEKEGDKMEHTLEQSREAMTEDIIKDVDINLIEIRIKKHSCLILVNDNNWLGDCEFKLNRLFKTRQQARLFLDKLLKEKNSSINKAEKAIQYHLYDIFEED